ncbi:MAG: hypothetical protein C5B45_01025 [Chlamydiae bacterium]|nr:MAG: hypothetical protein C5B45_01025 [Chlamydiota bacterium]
MLLLINAVHTAIHENKDVSSLKSNRQDLCSLNSVFINGLPKLTISQNLIEKGNRCVRRLCPICPTTKHSREKERITELLGGDIYHAVKVKGCIKNKLRNLSNVEFARLETRCNRIRSPQHILGVFIENMYEKRRVPLFTEEQLEKLLSSWKELKDVIDQGVQFFKQEAANQKILLKKKISLQEEQLFVIQTLYDLSSENNITLEKWKSMDKNTKEKLFAIISQGNINQCLGKIDTFEKRLFEKSPNQKDLEELKSKIFASVKDALFRLK